MITFFITVRESDGRIYDQLELVLPTKARVSLAEAEETLAEFFSAWFDWASSNGYEVEVSTTRVSMVKFASGSLDWYLGN